MDIKLEAYEAHSIEQQARKEQYLYPFEQDMKNKMERWSEIERKYENKEGVTREELAFLINEIAFLFDSSVSEAVPYLQGHVKRLKVQFLHSQGIQAITEVLAVYFEGSQYIFEKELGIFGRKKIIDSCIDKAKEVLKETEEKANEVTLFIKRDYDYSEKWDKEKRRWEIVDHQQTINRTFLPKEIEWMLQHAKISIEEQVNTGKLYFLHHFDRIEKEKLLEKRIQNFSKVFTLYKEAFENMATEPIGLLDTGGHLEKMKNHLRNAKAKSDSAYHSVKEHVEEEK